MNKKNLKKNFIGLIIIGVIVLFFAFFSALRTERDWRGNFNYSNSIIATVIGGALFIGGIAGASTVKNDKDSTSPENANSTAIDNQASSFCTKCGKALNADANFCAGCGTSK